ncbi:hypothetical protein Hoch_5159 [Haliangium ochraceum DSM 14365]|uniref:Uncharacterized protein n=1 Tax=Haliangium ochraceum (strain DSM 14365 / JCM 11303 / SMP-2) TaxID=502025 RepID=D0LWJ7_HALO1|nr:hypothetical protein Hoch_5159 [Haliangium ochraceum DSM 14365]
MPVSTLDGVYVLLGPLLTLTRMERAWDLGGGGAISLVRVRERAAISALGGELGALRLAAEDRGRAWFELLLGSDLGGRLPGPVGVGAGVDLAIDRVAPPRWGTHAMLWMYAGIIPYARLGVWSDGQGFIELGVRMALPALRW